MTYALLIALSKPAAWQHTPTGLHGPFTDPDDPRIELLTHFAVRDDPEATVTLLPLRNPGDALRILIPNVPGAGPRPSFVPTHEVMHDFDTDS